MSFDPISAEPMHTETMNPLERTRKKLRWVRYVIYGVVALSTVVLFGVCIYMGWAWTQTYFSTIISLLFGAYGVVAAVLTSCALYELSAAETHLVNTVEDATRREVKGFAAVFERAEKLVRRAQRELWMVNCTLNFGEIHEKSCTVLKDYNELTNNVRIFSEDVQTFWNSLVTKVHSLEIPAVNIVTLNDGSTKTRFVTRLGMRPGYEYVAADVDSYAQAIIHKKEQFKKMAAGREALRWRNGQPKLTVHEAEGLPMQILIAGLPNNKRGCLVFLIGTENADSNIVRGFYTEMESQVEVFKDIASNLQESAKCVLELPPPRGRNALGTERYERCDK